MSGLEALSLACNIMQIIDFACEATRLCKSVYQNGKIDPQLESVALSLSAVAKEAQDHHGSLTYKTDTDRRLEEMASKCLVAARELNEEVVYLQKGSKQGDLVATFRVAVKVNWRRRRLDRLEASLAKYQATMQTQLLSRLCKQHDAATLSQRIEFDHLNATLQQLITSYSADKTNIQLHIRREAATSRSHATSQNRRLEKSLIAHVTRSSEDLEYKIGSTVARHSNKVTDRLSSQLDDLNMRRATEGQRQRLLASLRFPEMNGRVNTLEDAHDQTFTWIFDPENKNQLEYDEGTARFRSRSPGYGTKDEHPDSMPFATRAWDDLAEWLKSESKIYWISGLPGSGKSTLMKYLVSQSKTRDCLNAWQPQALLLDHFFWKPGIAMQNSIRGMMCSLIHQFFSRKPEALASVCTEQPFLLEKNTCSDWSNKELRALMLMLLSHFAPLCIFVDGLDEAPESDYCRTLLDLLEEIASLPGVKICAASRPEPLLKRRLESYPHLRLQDLTAADLRVFGRDAFERENSRLDSPQQQQLMDLIDSLVRKAEGVFLWLRLTVNDTLRDLEHGYSIEELHQKVDRLPRTLTALYTDMWSRLNDDKSENDREGAEIFNLIIEFKSYSDLLYSKVPSWMTVGNTQVKLQLADVLAMIDPEMRKMMSEPVSFGQPDIHRRLHRAVRDVEARCAGLLSISIPHDAGSTVDFIHRSAYDFMVDTDEGQRIRQADTSSPVSRCLRLLRGLITSSRITGVQSIKLISVAVALPWLVPELKKPERARCQLGSEVTMFLKECFKCFGSGYFADTSAWPYLEQTTLFCWCLAFPPYYDHIRTFLLALPTAARVEAATTLLRQIWELDARYLDWLVLDHRMIMVRELLQLGASSCEYGLVIVPQPWHQSQADYYRYGTAASRRSTMVLDAWTDDTTDLQLWNKQPGTFGTDITRSLFTEMLCHRWELEECFYLAVVVKDEQISFLHSHWEDRTPKRTQQEEKASSVSNGTIHDGNKHDKKDEGDDDDEDVSSISNKGEGEEFEEHADEMFDPLKPTDQSSMADSDTASNLSLGSIDLYRKDVILVMDVNLAYLMRAIALRIAYYEKVSPENIAQVLDDVAPGLAQVEPHAVPKYIKGPKSLPHPRLERRFKVISGGRSQKLQESLNRLILSEVSCDEEMCESTLDDLDRLTQSEEVEEVFESITELLARERRGWIRRDDWEKEQAAKAARMGVHQQAE